MARLQCLKSFSDSDLPPDVEDLTDEYLDDWTALLMMDAARVEQARKQAAKPRRR